MHTCGDCSLNLITVGRKEMKEENSSNVSIGNSMICSDIWHKYHKVVFCRLLYVMAREI